jgi:hypothetical protein
MSANKPGSDDLQIFDIYLCQLFDKVTNVPHDSLTILCGENSTQDN